MRQIVMFVTMVVSALASTGHTETAEQKVARWSECAEHQRMIEAWDAGDREQIVRRYGDFSEQVVDGARLMLRIRIEDDTAPNGWRYHCPPEYHVE